MLPFSESRVNPRIPLLSVQQSHIFLDDIYTTEEKLKKLEAKEPRLATNILYLSLKVDEKSEIKIVDNIIINYVGFPKKIDLLVPVKYNPESECSLTYKRIFVPLKMKVFQVKEK